MTGKQILKELAKEKFDKKDLTAYAITPSGEKFGFFTISLDEVGRAVNFHLYALEESQDELIAAEEQV